MPTKKPTLQAVVEKETYLKIKQLAKEEKRSLSNYTTKIIEDYINIYEAEHGNIPINNENNEI